MTLTIAPLHGPEIPQLLRCWSRALPFDAITREVFEQKVLLDDSYEPESVAIARWGDGPSAPVVGFIVCFVLHRAIEKVGSRPDTGFITAFGVDPDFRRRGIGTALIEYAENFFRLRNRTIVTLAPYTPNYFVPGIDKDNYAEGFRYLGKRGYVETVEALAADANISTFQVPAKTLEQEAALRGKGITIRAAQRVDWPSLTKFLIAEMPGPWLEDSRRLLRQISAASRPAPGVFLALDSSSGTSQIIGYCQHDHDHFGPFGVQDGYQGQGVGSVLLARTLEHMRHAGYHCAWVVWTSQRALDGVYGRFGFQLTRRFAILRKTLS